jgi:hypothetical protein
MTPGWEDFSNARHTSAPPRVLHSRAQSIDLPLGVQGADFYFTFDGRLIALPKKRVAARARQVVLKGLTVAGFVLVAAACGAILA